VLISVLSNAGFGFELINSVYCDNDDDIVVSDSIKDVKIDDKNYHFSISKNFVKDGFESVLKVLSDSLPEVVGALGGVKLGTTVMKGVKTGNLMQKAAYGVATAGAGMIALGLGGTVVQAIRKNNENAGGDHVIIKIPRASFEKLMKDDTGELQNEFLKKAAKKVVDYKNNNENINNSGSGTESGSSSGAATGSGSGTRTGTESGTSTVPGTGTGTGSSSENLNNAMDKLDLGRGYGSNFIPSLLDGNLSPLELLINCEILINIMLLIHIILLVLILIHKFNLKIITSSSVGFIKKYLIKYKLNKLQNFIKKTGEISNKYLSLLIIVNVFIIIFYIFLNVYINIELSSNLNEYIHVYNKFQIKESGILLLLFNNKIKYHFVNRLEKRMYSSISDRVDCVLKGNDQDISTEVVSNNENNRSISLSNINYLVEKENIIKSKNKYLGGFTTYNKVVVLNNFIFTIYPNMVEMSIDRESLLLSVRNFLSNLDDDKTYSVLFSGQSCNGGNINHTISNSSMIIHKQFSDSGLTEILLNDINRYLNTYLPHICNSEMNFLSYCSI
jgi:hypothetical protein